MKKNTIVEYLENCKRYDVIGLLSEGRVGNFPRPTWLATSPLNFDERELSQTYVTEFAR